MGELHLEILKNRMIRDYKLKVHTSALPVQMMTCARLVLSAGAFGTPYLLLRNADAFPAWAAIASISSSRQLRGSRA